MQTGVEARQWAEFADAGDLVQKRARLVGEQIGHTVTDAAGIHRQPAADVGVFRPDQHPPGTGDVAADIVGGDLELAGRCRFHDAEPFEAKSSKPRPSGRLWATRDAEKVPTAPLSNRRERGHVLVLHRCELVADGGLGVSVGNADGHGPLRDQRGERGAAHLGDRPADEFRRSIRWLPTSASAPVPGPPR